MDIENIVSNAAGKLGVEMDPEVPSLVSDYTIEGRKATSLLVDAYGIALFREMDNRQDGKANEAASGGDGPVRITLADLEETIRLGRFRRTSMFAPLIAPRWGGRSLDSGGWPDSWAQ